MSMGCSNLLTPLHISQANISPYACNLISATYFLTKGSAVLFRRWVMLARLLALGGIPRGLKAATGSQKMQGTSNNLCAR